MSGYLLFNDSFYKNDSPLVSADNRGLRYGDGLFETLKFEDGSIALERFHFDRLFSGLQLLQFEIPAHFTAGHLAAQVKTLCRKNGHNTARVRINIFRGNGGVYDPENHLPNYIIQSWALAENAFRLNQNGLVTGFYRDARKATDSFSNLKSNNYLPYLMAALHAKKQQWNEAFLLNTNGNVCDATIANIFIIKDETIYTCTLQDGCVAGVMRRFLLESLPAHGFKLVETSLSEQDILAADEVFLTNSIKGIRWVGHCGNASYTNRMTTTIFNKLLKK